MRRSRGRRRPTTWSATRSRQEFELVESDSPYALEVGSEVPAEGQLPLPNTAADIGPNQAALLIFEVSDEVSENRPLDLEIQTFDGNGEVILDI